MSVRMRHTRSHTRNRRSHHALTAASIVTDKDSGKLRLPHRIDEATGMYRGKQIAAPKAEKVKAAKHVHHEHAHDGHDHPHDEVKPAEAKAAEKTAVKTRAKSRSNTGS